MLGFDRCCFLVFPPSYLTNNIPPSFALSTFPESTANHFLENKVYEVSSYLPSIKNKGRPVLWKDTILKKDPGKFHSKYAAFVKNISNNGRNNLLTIPVYGNLNTFGTVILQSTVPDIKTDDHNVILARSMSDDLMHQYTRFSSGEQEDASLELSLREKEVLLWVVRGKSNSVIAEIMNLSPHTIDTYIRRCCQKTNTTNRTEAAIRAILSGAIHY